MMIFKGAPTNNYVNIFDQDFNVIFTVVAQNNLLINIS